MGHDVHTYRAVLSWEGSTGVGYEGYERTHSMTSPPAEQELTLASDPAFRGSPALLNPEQLLVQSASSCQLLSFLAVAARARLDVRAYQDDATGEMPEDRAPMWITHIVLRPRITVVEGPTEQRLRHLCEVAHRECFIANSLKTEVLVEPTFTFVPA
jgi:organic hydroperoxide reductase OsmC/OhrA